MFKVFRQNRVNAAVLERIPEEVLFVVEALKTRGFQAYLVGGALRDLFLRRTPGDWDVATDAVPSQVEEIFPQTVAVGKRFGTIKVPAGDLVVDVTTFRREGAYSDGRRPDWVEFECSPLSDLSRRDFTVNALALDPFTKELLDPFGGRRDLRKKIIRTVGEPRRRFAEDALRMLRFYRFQSVLAFRGDPETERGIEPSLLTGVSAERIRDELNAILTGVAPGMGLRGLVRTGLLAVIAPEYEPAIKSPEIMEHLIATVEAVKPSLHLRWAAFLHDLGKPASRTEDRQGKIHYFGHEQAGERLAAGILERLRFSRAFQKRVLTLVRRHMFLCDSAVTDAALRRLAARVGRDNLFDLLELRRADIVAYGRNYHHAWENLSRFSARVQAMYRGEKALTPAELAVNGHDVMEILNLAPGPQVGRILDELFYWVTEDPERNTRKELLQYLKSKKNRRPPEIR